MIRKNRAFSLIEILIVLAIAGLIASLVYPVVTQGRDKAAYQTSMANLYQVAKAMEKHYLETGKYPVFSNWEELSSSDALTEYINEIPKTDDFNRPYRLELSTETEYTLMGFGIPGKLAKTFPDYSFSTNLKKKGGPRG